MQSIYVVDDIQQAYADFIKNSHYPKLESLTNWGKNRFFFSRYFKLIEDWHHTEQIVIELNRHFYSLDTGAAPDFLDQDKYLAWLREELSCQLAC